MQQTLASAVARLNRVKHISAFIGFGLRTLRSTTLAVMTLSVWAIVRPQEELEQIVLGCITFFVTFIMSFFSGRIDRSIQPKELALALEMQHGRQHQQALTNFATDVFLSEDWQESIDLFHADLVRFESKRNLSLASSLIIPLALASLTFPQAVPSLRMALSEVSGVVSLLSRGATLRVIQGSTGETPNKSYQLAASAPVEVELLAQNLIEIKLSGGGFGRSTPIVELRRPGEPLLTKRNTVPPTDSDQSKEIDEKPLSTVALPWEKSADSSVTSALETSVSTASLTAASPDPKLRDDSSSQPGQSIGIFQRFQMIPVRHPSHTEDTGETSHFSISFAVTEAVDLYIPQFESTRPLARLKVRQLPLPKVTLQSLSPPEDPWPDDQPLNLRITVRAENPLQLVRLLIKSGTRISKELVANVMTEDRTELSTDYRLVLETYVESDLANVEIVAEAIDRAVPTPLAGYSEPLRLNTASAYGRYRAALQTLRDLKTELDDALSKQNFNISKNSKDLAKLAAVQSERSPFFDGLDRVQLHRFEKKVSELASKPDMEGMLDLSQQINEFLFEHEILDDRERDRDFFVATRSLSRLVEEEIQKRPVSIKTVIERMQKFLDDRHVRWDKRVERLPADQKPPQWPNLSREKPFHATLSRIEELDDRARSDPKARTSQMAELSKTVVDYRAWIEDLEAREDRVRESEEQQRQEGLASAQNVLRELQQRQGEISTDLDRAADRQKPQMNEQWTSIRMKQNTNARETKRLEGQMRALAPSASARIEAAQAAMEETIEAGNDGDFTMAESNSDLAGRLLRQAERAASQSQQKRRSRGRRRRVTGDNYYGQSVVGGDIEIKREYEVDRRYREDILDEVQDANLDDEQRALLENYLRQIVR